VLLGRGRLRAIHRRPSGPICAILKAEGFARFFGRPVFLVAQTLIVGVWITLNTMSVFNFDIYPLLGSA